MSNSDSIFAGDATLRGTSPRPKSRYLASHLTASQATLDCAIHHAASSINAAQAAHITSPYRPAPMGADWLGRHRAAPLRIASARIPSSPPRLTTQAPLRSARPGSSTLRPALQASHRHALPCIPLRYAHPLRSASLARMCVLKATYRIAGIPPLRCERSRLSAQRFAGLDQHRIAAQATYWRNHAVLRRHRAATPFASGRPMLSQGRQRNSSLRNTSHHWARPHFPPSMPNRVDGDLKGVTS